MFLSYVILAFGLIFVQSSIANEAQVRSDGRMSGSFDLPESMMEKLKETFKTFGQPMSEMAQDTVNRIAQDTVNKVAQTVRAKRTPQLIQFPKEITLDRNGTSLESELKGEAKSFFQ